MASIPSESDLTPTAAILAAAVELSSSNGSYCAIEFLQQQGIPLEAALSLLIQMDLKRTLSSKAPTQDFMDGTDASSEPQ